MFLKIQKSFKLLVVITICAIAVVPLLLAQESTDNYVLESWASTELKLARYRFIWTINNFEFLETKDTYSPAFGDVLCQWRLKVVPRDDKMAEPDTVSVYLNSHLCKHNISAHYSIGIINANNKEIRVRKSNNLFAQHTSRSWGFQNFIKRNYLFNEDNQLLSDQKLTIFCNVSYVVSSHTTSGKFVQPSPKSLMVKDFEFLFENQNFSDVILTVGGKEFYALKAILAARSATFRNTFEQDMNEIKMICVEDVTPKVVKEMLRYIYTDEVSNLEYLAPDLLAASEKYQLDGLKILCENFLSKNLTIENACEFFVLGDTYLASNLKAKAKNFITTHISRVAQTTGFESVIQTHPNFIIEIFRTP